jgi:hypothetical protein
MPPAGAAITIEALSTGLRQYQPDSRQPVTVGVAGRCRPVTAGTSLQIATGRFREAGESTVTKDTAGARRTRELRNAARAYFGQSQFVVDDVKNRSPRHARRSNIFHAGICFSRTHQSAHPAAGCRYHTEDQNAALARCDESGGDDRFAAPK